MGEPAELSATDLARAVTFADQVVQSVVDDAAFPRQMSPDIDPQMTLLIMSQTILLLFKEANSGR